MAWSCQRGVVWDSVIGVDLRAAPAAWGGSALLTRKPWRVSVVQTLSATVLEVALSPTALPALFQAPAHISPLSPCSPASVDRAAPL